MEKKKFNDVANTKCIPMLEFKGTTERNLVPLLIDESSMCYENGVKEYFIKTACYHKQKIDKLREQAKS